MSAAVPHPVAYTKSTNPRRVAAEASVSLKKRPATGPLSFASDAPSVGDVSSASIVAANGERPSPPARLKSQETQNADKWFDDSNKNAAGKTNVRFIDDDPPFYLKKQRSSEDDGEDTRGGQFSSSKSKMIKMPSLAAGPSQICTPSSTSDDYRSVIDDLTVENQELKRKLRKYEGGHCEHLQDDKLFEVKVYGMSQARRRKLERLLRDFVSNMGPSPPESMSGTVSHLPSLAPLPHPPLQPLAVAHGKRSNSSSSNRPADSAYASMSVSNTASISQHQTQSEPRPRPIRPAAPQAPQKDQRVHSYLQNISKGLLPRYPPFMTEKAKKRLVVRRLEQLFVGRGDATSKHSQSQQQQEVSQSAASADRKEVEAMGHPVQVEGRREAKMSALPEQPTQVSQPQMLLDVPYADTPIANNGTTNGASLTPDQRPTRPLDLDPSRAQNPQETINYMKHLGFASPKMYERKSVEDSEGWIYLNLLINMAQLHTLNVTPDFVRTAISELSSKFEISEDGQNVRWEGGYRGSKLSSDSSQDSEGSNDNSSPPDDQGVSKASKPSTKPMAATTDGSRRLLPGSGVFPPLRHWPNSQNRSEYQYYSPLFYFPEEASAGSSPEEVPSNSLIQTEEKSNEISKEISMGNAKPFQTRQTGSLIFYRQARFCTDLKGDPTFPHSNVIYDRESMDALGSSQQQKQPEIESPIDGKGELSSPDKPTFSPTETGSKDLDMAGMDTFPSAAPAWGKPKPTKNLHASGIGGVTPADNFCIKARRKFGTGESELVEEQRHEMDPSSLPPPSYAILHHSSSSSDAEDSDDDEEEEDIVAEQDPFLSTFAAKLSGSHFVPPNYVGEFSSNSVDKSGSVSRDTSDESSFDMLEYARKADPDTVAAQEREFERHVMPENGGAPPPAGVAVTLDDRSMQGRKSGALKREYSDMDYERVAKDRKIEV